MKPNIKFKRQSDEFWAYVRIISDITHYSTRKSNSTISEIKAHPAQEIISRLKLKNIAIDPVMLQLLVDYFLYRKKVLENIAEPCLMDVDESKNLYLQQLSHHKSLYGEPESPQPLNKQSGKKKRPAYFTGQINLLTEEALIKFNSKYHTHITCDYDPRKLTYFSDDNNYLITALSRRFDGAIPAIQNPFSIWEIKEYYYTTTFGSRISDGVYETQLDGHEIKDAHAALKRHISHNFLIDSHRTWWGSGKSYLCRIIDALNMGIVDQVMFGKEIYYSWPSYINNICTQIYDLSKKSKD